ncbi:hypothetical protein ACFLRM_00980 [Acidobacteriota bacterium]
MRKWLLLLLIILVFYALSKLRTNKQEKKYPALKQISQTFSILVWALLIVYVLAFLYWLFTVIFK